MTGSAACPPLPTSSAVDLVVQRVSLLVHVQVPDRLAARVGYALPLRISERVREPDRDGVYISDWQRLVVSRAEWDPGAQCGRVGEWDPIPSGADDVVYGHIDWDYCTQSVTNAHVDSVTHRLRQCIAAGARFNIGNAGSVDCVRPSHPCSS